MSNGFAELGDYELWRLGGYNLVAVGALVQVSVAYNTVTAVMLRRGASVVAAVAEHERPGRRLILLLPLLALWANLHGSVVLGAGLACSYLLYRATAAARRRWWAPTAGCTLLDGIVGLRNAAGDAVWHGHPPLLRRVSAIRRWPWRLGNGIRPHCSR